MTFILAANLREATAIARKRKLGAKEWQFLTGVHQLLGRRDVTIIQTKCWAMMSPITQFMELSYYLKSDSAAGVAERIIEECH